MEEWKESIKKLLIPPLSTHQPDYEAKYDVLKRNVIEMGKRQWS